MRHDGHKRHADGLDNRLAAMAVEDQSHLGFKIPATATNVNCANDNGETFPHFYMRVSHMFSLSGDEYGRAWRKMKAESKTYCAQLYEAYQSQGFNFNVDMTEPREIIMFEMVRYFSDRHYSAENQKLLHSIQISLASLHIKSEYSHEFKQAATKIFAAAEKFSNDPAGLTYGDIFVISPPLLGPIPEFCPRFVKTCPAIPAL